MTYAQALKIADELSHPDRDEAIEVIEQYQQQNAARYTQGGGVY